MDYIAQPKDYWIAQGAITITLNALGNPNRMQGSVASGAAILCYIEGVDGLGYDNGHRFKTWPLSLSPTYFNSYTPKYVYAAIPRTATVGTQAVVVFPSEKLDIYGKNAEEMQVGSADYYYIWLQGIISSSGEYGTTNRTWTAALDFGKKGTDEDLYDDTDGEWYQYSKVSGLVTFLKNIQMKAGTTFHNIFLGYKELTGVATATTGEEYVDSETLVVTPSYLQGKYLSRQKEDVAQEQIGFLKGLWIGIKGLYEITAEGVAKFKSLFVDDITAQRIQVDDVQSPNYTGDGIADTGWRLTKDYNGHSKLTVDELYVRMKAVFESLEIKKEMVTGGNQIFSRAANVISRTDYYNSDDEQIGYSEVKVPWLLRGLQMVLSKRILSGIYSKVRSIRISIDDPTEIAYIRCYFLAEEGGRKVNNLWSVTGGHDLARCQTFNLSQSQRETYVEGTEVKQGNVFWWRKVISVSSNSSPVEIDGKKYHYFDVSNQQGGYLAGSDLPCAGDEVSQWGNDGNEARMHLVTIEVDGGVAIKGYEGIYTFDMSKCWYGGNPCKMNLSPQDEYRFTGRKFKIETEYGIRPVPFDIDVDWASQTKSRAEYAETGIAVGDLIVKNYYYDRVPHNGSLWLCLFEGNPYWARYAKYDNGTISYVTEDVFNTLSDDEKLYVKVSSRTGLADNQVCRRQEYTAAEPGTNSAVWKQEVAKGEKGDGQPDYIQTQEAWSSVESVANVTTEPTPNGGWSDTTPANSNNYAYLWRRSRKMVLQSDGTYAAATGSDGQWKYARLSGTNGTSISVKGTVATVADLSNITNPQDGDAYVVSANGHLYMWSSEASDWIDLGQFKGDPGVTYYTHVAWASAVTLGTTPSGHTTTGQTTTPNATSVTGFNMSPFTGAAWMGILVNTVASDSNDGLAYTWKKVEGPQGEDAVSIVISPASLIVNQDLNYTTNLSNLTEKFVVRVYKGSAEHGQELTVNGLSFVAETVPNSNPTAYKCLFLNGGGQRSGNSSIAGNELTLKEIRTYTQGGKTLYYDSMFVDVTATYNTNKTIKARVRIYANLLGTWSEEVVGDAKTEVANSINYLYDPNNPNQVVKQTNYAEYVQSSTQSISTIKQRLGNTKNLLTGALTAEDYQYGFLNARGVFSKQGNAFISSDGYIARASDGMSDLIISPNFYLEHGKYYTLSFDSIGEEGDTEYEAQASLNTRGGSPITLTKTGNHYVGTFQYDGESERINIIGFYAYKIYHPQLEEGSTETSFETGDVTSQIKQTADAITLAVQQGYATKSDLQITADGITAEVNAIKAGKNLFSGALTGAGWYSESSVPYDNHPQSQVSVDSNGYMNVLSGGNYICKAVTIERNVDYVLSLFGKVTSSFQVGVWIPASSAVNWQQVTTLSFSAVSSTDTRRVKSFKLSGSGSATILFTIPLAAIRYPQLEIGETATAFDAGDTEVSSQIKQTADEINLSVRGDVAGRNINLLYGVDGYTSSNKLVHKSSGTDGVVEYDGGGNHPHIFTSVQLVKGCTYTIQCVTDGTIASSHAGSETPSSKLCTIWLRMNSLLNGGYNGEVFTSSRDGYQNLGGGRHKWTFVCQKTGEYWFRTNSYSDGTTEVTINFWNIKLEGGNSATAWSGSTSQMTSEIKQTADEINQSVSDLATNTQTALNLKANSADLATMQNGLETAGIHLDGQNSEINLIAGKVNFCNSQGTAQTYVQITSDGKIKATDGEFSGKIVANSGKIASGIIDGNWLISSYGQIDGDEYGDTDEFEGHLAHLYFDPSNPQGFKGIPTTIHASAIEPETTYSDAASVMSDPFTPTVGLRIVKIDADVFVGEMKVALFSNGSMISGTEITLTPSSYIGYIVFTSSAQQCEVRAHMTEDSIYGVINGIYQMGFAPHFAVDLSAGKSYQDDANIGGIIKAQIAYTPTKTYNRSTTAETIVPGANYPSAYRVVTGTANKVFTLPDPRDYDGLELSFFVTQYPGTGYGCILKAPTGYSIYFNKHQVVYIDGSNFALPVVNEVESKTQVICGFGQNVTLRAMDNNWYVVQGRVS